MLAIAGQNNSKRVFIDSIGNPVRKARTFYNGATIDNGPSDLAPAHPLPTEDRFLLRKEA